MVALQMPVSLSLCLSVLSLQLLDGFQWKYWNGIWQMFLLMLLQSFEWVIISEVRFFHSGSSLLIDLEYQQKCYVRILQVIICECYECCKKYSHTFSELWFRKDIVFAKAMHPCVRLAVTRTCVTLNCIWFKVKKKYRNINHHMLLRTRGLNLTMEL